MLIAYSYEYNIKTIHLILAPYLISTDLHERPWAKARAAASAPLRSSLLDRERHDAEVPPVWGQTVLAEFQAAQEAELHGARSRGRREPVVGLEAPDPSAEEAVDVEDEGGGRARGRFEIPPLADLVERTKEIPPLDNAAAKQEAHGGDFV